MSLLEDLKLCVVKPIKTTERELEMFKKFDLIGLILIVGLILFILIAPASASKDRIEKKPVNSPFMNRTIHSL